MGVSIWQILIVVAVVVLLFGARRLPELGKSLGEAINGFKKGLSSDDSIDVTNSSDPSASNDKQEELEESLEHQGQKRKSRAKEKA